HDGLLGELLQGAGTGVGAGGGGAQLPISVFRGLLFLQEYNQVPLFSRESEIPIKPIPNKEYGEPSTKTPNSPPTKEMRLLFCAGGANHCRISVPEARQLRKERAHIRSENGIRWGGRPSKTAALPHVPARAQHLMKGWAA
ncbi:hypothetical protein ACWDZ8_42655, partial [Streptomyces sp. NPDC003233]